MRNKKTICLNMIVKNERHVIQRCFDSLKNYIDYWVISDTGSIDGTQDFIKSYFKNHNIPGELIENEWQDFAFNRNIALKQAFGKADYILFMDADDYIEYIDEKGFYNLSHDAYRIMMKLGTLQYQNIKLVKATLPWLWEGVLHETLDCKVNYSIGDYDITKCLIRSTTEGARNNDIEKYKKDAKVLETALVTEPENSRYKFYLANSYRDFGDYQNAAKWYEKRIQDQGWREEVSCSYYNLGICYEELGLSEKALNSWLMGYDYDPSRMESLYRAVSLLRNQEKYRLGYQLGLIAKNIPYPKNDILFIQSRIYSFWIYYELSICAYYVNDFQLGYDCCKTVLFNQPEPNILEITINNLRFYKEYATHDTFHNVKKLINLIQDYLIKNENKHAENILNYLQSL